MSVSKWNDDIFKRAEEQLRSGNLDEVKDLVNKIATQSIPRQYLVQVANLARRVGFHRTAIRLLNPITRPTTPVHPPASNEEFIEYAASLQRIGQIHEAQNILSQIKNPDNPEIYLYQGFCSTALWDYENTITFLQKYLLEPKITSYQKSVAKINLAAAFIYTLNYDQADKLLSQIIAELSTDEHKLALGYSHQTYAELHTCTGQYQKAIEHLNDAQKLLGTSHYRYAIYNQQWRAIIELMTANKPALVSKAQKNLKKIAEEALKRKVWEVARDCDLYLALKSERTDDVLKVYFGTPLAGYRARILKLYEKKIAVPATFTWYPAGTPSAGQHCLDTVTGIDLLSGAKLKQGQLLHRLLQTLASDFYRSFKVGPLFSKLFPNEYYNPDSSPQKIYDLIKRLREWFSENNIPIVINVLHKSEYQLTTSRPYGILVSALDSAKTSEELFIDKIRSEFGFDWFVIKDLLNLIDASRSTTKRNLKAAIATKQILLEGEGRRAKYRLAG